MSDVRPMPTVLATGVVVVVMPTASAIMAGGNQPPMILERLTAMNRPVKPDIMLAKYWSSNDVAKMRTMSEADTTMPAMSTILRVPILSEMMPVTNARKTPSSCDAE